MPEFRKDVTKPTLRAMEARKEKTRPYRQKGEIIRWQSLVLCIEAPAPYGPSEEADLAVTIRQFFYFPDDHTVVRLPFSEIGRWEFSKKNRDSVILSIHMASSDLWRFEMWPMTARMMKRCLRKFPKSK